MRHKGTVTMETDRLVLRKITMEDAEAGFRNWMSDNRVTEFLRWPTHTDISVSKWVIGEWISEYEKENFYQWAIELKDLGEPIGTISVVGMDEKTKKVPIGYCIGRKWWRQGYTSEALAALISFFFEEVGANRIEAQHDPNNPGSGMVMKKCGMKYEGTLRSSDRNNQGICDACWYALLRSER